MGVRMGESTDKKTDDRMGKSTDKKTGEHLGKAYGRMLERAGEGAKQGSPGTRLQQLLDQAKDKTVELEELSREEAERISDYVRRDITDAAQFMVETGKELKDWLSFDLELVERRVLDMFAFMVDHTREELDLLALRAEAAKHLHTGEVTAMGTLRCTACGLEMHLKKPGRIPPCPKCHGTDFERVSDE